MLKLPNCDFCQYYLDNNRNRVCCQAFPEGIPLDVMIKAEPGVECAPGYTFTEKESDNVYEEPPEDGILKKIMR
ncbi:hypothetical protein PMZ84_14750 [[Clostridium] symbiosum]|uniref:hypothetical protein n=1 Tax=Clostridium symbiosum TaxID=1512 RepID=UPI00232E9823|nr:hypothetical protein [[Clostridium] symbiosum]MDB2032475.1 hypothetical protein [[Clostridium] symbiosum]